MLSRFGFGNKVHQRARPLRGYHTFGMLAHAQAPARYSARELSQDCLSYMDHRNGLDAISEPGFVGFTLAVQNQLLAELADARVIGQYTDAIIFTTAYSEHALDAFETDVALTILHVGDLGSSKTTVRHPTRQRARRRAVDYLRNNRKCALTVHTLCDVAACSVSTLERAFLDEYGIGPKRYILQERLRASLGNPPLVNRLLIRRTLRWR